MRIAAHQGRGRHTKRRGEHCGLAHACTADHRCSSEQLHLPAVRIAWRESNPSIEAPDCTTSVSSEAVCLSYRTCSGLVLLHVERMERRVAADERGVSAEHCERTSSLQDRDL